MHGIFLEACRRLWNSRKHKQHYDAIAEMNKELAKHDASSASFVCIAGVPQHKANAARAEFDTASSCGSLDCGFTLYACASLVV